MSDELYELLALSARYFFAILMGLIAFRAISITIKDSRRAGKLRRWAPETGLSGELVVLEESERVRRGMRYPVIREGIIGSSRAADIRIRNSSIRRRHAHFELREDGVRIRAYGAAGLFTEDGDRARSLLAQDGDRFRVGKVHVLLVLFDAAGNLTEVSPRRPVRPARPVVPEDAPSGADPLFEAPGPDAADSLFEPGDALQTDDEEWF